MSLIYLDNAASTKPVDSILDAITPYITSEYFNPSAKYSCSQRVKEKIENVRERIADSIGANKNEIIFNSGATEGNNTVIRGFLDACKLDEAKPFIITTNIEHNSINSCLTNMYLLNDDLCNPKEYELKVNQDGYISIYQLNDLLKSIYSFRDKYTFGGEYESVRILVSICMGNNEIGTIQDIKEIAELVHEYEGILHVDATQCYGHIPFDVNDLNIDIMTTSAQKLGGLKGTGFIYIDECLKDLIRPLIYGSQQNGMRAGTENVVGIVAFGEAIKNIDYTKEMKIQSMREYMIDELTERFDCKINGSLVDRLPNNISVTFNQNITGESLIYLLDMANILISAGSACNTNKIKNSQVLQAIGLSDEEIAKTIRITLPDDITVEKIDRTISEIEKAIQLITEGV